CDSVLSGNGRVIDKETKRPVPGVRISVMNLDTVFTDSRGYFRFSKVVHGSAIGGMVNPQILVEGSDYKPLVTTVTNREGQLFELEPITKEHHTVISFRTIRNFSWFNRYVIPIGNL